MSSDLAEVVRRNWAIDHVFVFVDEDDGVPAMQRLGFAENYRRRHTGQGTANACYCFDNAYLELLWPVDAAELASPAVSPTGLAERADWRRTGACPFGIALRPVGGLVDENAEALPLDHWAYEAPFLPEGMSLPVADFSRDHRLPFVFRSPGGTPPIDWTDDRAGERQRPAGWRQIDRVGLTLPDDAAVPDGLAALAEAGVIDLRSGAGPAMTLDLVGEGRRATLILPGFDLQ